MIPKGYFNKLIVRSLSIILLLYLVYYFFTFGLNNPIIKVCCSEDYNCDNPLYVCNNEINFIKDINWNCEAYRSFNCEGQEICSIEKIPAKSCIENESNFIHKNFLNIYLILLAVGFSINHLLWKVKK